MTQHTSLHPTVPERTRATALLAEWSRVVASTREKACIAGIMHACEVGICAVMSGRFFVVGVSE